MSPLDGRSLIGMGCMRLSTAPDRDEDRAVSVIHSALDAGVNLLDTADAYCLDRADAGHNERLIARALSGWAGDRGRVLVATKGGLTRPGGRWVVDGRAKHLEAAAAASCTALGVECLDLYQLHAPDPRVPIGRSVRALRRLQERGLVRHIGLCNVSLGQIVEAAAIAEIAAVQIKLGPLALDAVRGGVVEHCRDRGILVIAHTPLGGRAGVARLARDAVLCDVAARHGVDAALIALAWLRDLAEEIVPIPGATRPERAVSAAAGQRLCLSPEERRTLDERFGAVGRLRTPVSRLRPPARASGEEVVLIMGCPAAGKSTLAQAYVERGHVRLNRDEAGGRLRDLVSALDEGLAGGARRFVLDNTYPTRAGRNEVIEAAWRHSVPVRCVWLQTSLEDAGVNAAQRMIERFGALLDPEQIRALSRTEPAALPPGALFEYRRRFEEPVPEEGFSAIEVVPFQRRRPAEYTARAIILNCDAMPDGSSHDGSSHDGSSHDGSSHDGSSHDGPSRDGPSRDGAIEAARERARREGRLLLGLSWRDGPVPGGLDVLRCLHRSGPPACWCRKPLPGLAVALVERHRLDPAGCLLVGKGALDATLARRAGFEFAGIDALFAP